MSSVVAGGWWILLEVDVQLAAHDVVRPDLSGWHRDRLTNPWDQRPIEVVPDWICEVLSPSNQPQDRDDGKPARIALFDAVELDLARVFPPTP